MIGDGDQGMGLVGALASHQCVPGSIPGPDVICGLSLLLVLSSAPRGFFSGYSGFPLSSKNQTKRFKELEYTSSHFGSLSVVLRFSEILLS